MGKFKPWPLQANQAAGLACNELVSVFGND